MSKVDFDLTKQMQEDLIAAYKAVSGTCWTQREAYEKMVKQPAPRYYITPKQALQVLSPMVKGDFERVNMMMPRKRRMYYSLYEVVMKLSEQRSFMGKKLYYILRYAVTQPAPEFFIGANRARQIRGWLKNGSIGPSGKVDEEKVPCYARAREKKRDKIISRRT